MLPGWGAWISACGAGGPREAADERISFTLAFQALEGLKPACPGAGKTGTKHLPGIRAPELHDRGRAFANTHPHHTHLDAAAADTASLWLSSVSASRGQAIHKPQLKPAGDGQ